MIKRSITVIAACLLLTASVSSTFAQARASVKTQVISVDGLGYFLNGHLISAQYEWRTSTTNSIHIRGIFSNYGGTNEYSGFGVGGAYRFYIIDSRALTGLSVAPVAHVFFLSSSKKGATTQVISVGGEVAYKWLFDQFSVEPGVGLQIGFLGDQVPQMTGTRPYAQIYLGYAW